MKYLLLLLPLIFSNHAWALDNPDAPDYVAEFEARMAPLHAFVQDKAETTPDYSEGYKALEDALDKELNSAYQSLMKVLPEASKEALRASQKQWIKYRDTEFEFIAKNFNKEDFGSSYVVSVGSYRSSIIEARIKDLLWYLKNY
jgi:uncharacterized protein YecT (DUF1311 family)